MRVQQRIRSLAPDVRLKFLVLLSNFSIIHVYDGSAPPFKHLDHILIIEYQF